MKAATSQPTIIKNARQASVVRGIGFMAAFGGADQGDAGMRGRSTPPGFRQAPDVATLRGLCQAPLDAATNELGRDPRRSRALYAVHRPTGVELM
jgi:hypothetical protein